MGFHVSWIAARGWTAEELVAETRWELSGEQERCLNVGVFAASPPGWALLVGDGVRYQPLVAYADALALSERTEVVFFATDDTTMISVLTFLRGGETVWTALADCSEGPAPVALTGAPPARALQLAAETEDSYEVPALLGEALVGFRHDRHHPVTLLHR
ncbi:MAG: hypothetical protein JXX28_03790 [Deltaproteobacteria bacterium]|nr:hypothetical protein [Deltaproteobacteria bacterium]